MRLPAIPSDHPARVVPRGSNPIDRNDDWQPCRFPSFTVHFGTHLWKQLKNKPFRGGSSPRKERRLRVRGRACGPAHAEAGTWG